MEKVRIGVAGCGNVARSTYLPGLLRPPLSQKIELVAVFSRKEEKARWARDTFGAREFYTDHDKMLAQAEIDAVINLTPKPVHAALGLAALEAGKHLFLEKPIATSMEDADRLIQKAKEMSLKLVCAPAIPIWPVMLTVNAMIEKGLIGQPCFARAHGSSAGPGTAWYYMKGAGPVFDLAVYSLSQLTAVLGPVKRVTAFSGISIPERVLKDNQRVRIDEDDNTHMLLDFGGNVFASCDGTYVVKGYNAPWIEFFGTEGTINIWRDGLYMWAEVYHSNPALGLKGWLSPRQHRLDHKDLFALGPLELVEWIVSDRQSVLSGERARHTLEIMLGAYRSARQGRVIELHTSF